MGGFTYFLTSKYFSCKLLSRYSNKHLKTENNLEEVVFVEKPDIYFFLYDGLASFETLENFYGFDTKNLKSISDNNFYIANNAISSYGITSMF